MKSKVTLITFFATFSIIAKAQYSQYFDGADTVMYETLFTEIDTAAENTWQVGVPQKVIFDSAATFPNVLITDTTDFYPINNRSDFQVLFPENYIGFSWGIFVLQWKQKIDLEDKKDGGFIEFKSSSDSLWQNAFNSPYVYNFYGWDSQNLDTLASEEIAFTGTDYLWRDVWLCFDLTWMQYTDTMQVRFSMRSDSVDTQQEGWMIDNMLAHITFFHTAKEKIQESYIKISPNPASDRINIAVQKISQPHIIEELEMYNSNGQLVQKHQIVPTKFFLETSDLPNGLYYIKIKTNIKTETHPVIIQH